MYMLCGLTQICSAASEGGSDQRQTTPLYWGGCCIGLTLQAVSKPKDVATCAFFRSPSMVFGTPTTLVCRPAGQTLVCCCHPPQHSQSLNNQVSHLALDQDVDVNPRHDGRQDYAECQTELPYPWT